LAGLPESLANPNQIAIVKAMTLNYTQRRISAVPAGQAAVRPGAAFYSSLSLLFLLP